jgi:sulfotransferase
MAEKIFFQSSMPRAMSTMLQNIIGQNPNFYVTPTSGVLELLFGARANFTNSPEFLAQDSKIMADGFRKFCFDGMNGYYNAITNKKYVLDKSRGWGTYRRFLNEIYPDPKIICMVRNLKDIISSYEKIYRSNQLKHNSIRNDAEARGTTIYKRIDEWVDGRNTIGRALERLLGIISEGYDNKILFVKAEDLCLYPDSTMIRIYDYLGIEHFQHDFDNIEQITTEDDSVYGLSPELHKIRSKLEMKQSDADSIIPTDARNWLYEKYKWYYDKFGYKK